MFTELTALEMQIILALLKGMTDAQIAEALQVSADLIIKRRKRIFKTLTGKEM